MSPANIPDTDAYPWRIDPDDARDALVEATLSTVPRDEPEVAA